MPHNFSPAPNWTWTFTASSFPARLRHPSRCIGTHLNQAHDYTRGPARRLLMPICPPWRNGVCGYWMPLRLRVSLQILRDGSLSATVQSEVAPASLRLTVRRGEIPPDSPEILQKIAENVPLKPLVWKRESETSPQPQRRTPAKSLTKRKNIIYINNRHNSLSLG